MRRNLIWATALILLMAPFTSNSQETKMTRQIAEEDKPFLLNYVDLENPYGEVVLSNEHVVLQRLVVGAGEWEGIHSHPGNQIFVHIKGGLWSGRLGGEVEYVGPADGDGAVGWMDAIPFSAGHDSGNVGDELIDLIYVTMKSDAPIAPDAEHSPQVYPNIPMEMLMENDRLIAQRLLIEPGEWTGVHSHPGNQVYLHVKGGIWSERRGGEQSEPMPVSEDGSVGWLDATEHGEEHEMGNTGDTTIELVLVTLK